MSLATARPLPRNPLRRGIPIVVMSAVVAVVGAGMLRPRSAPIDAIAEVDAGGPPAIIQGSAGPRASSDAQSDPMLESPTADRTRVDRVEVEGGWGTALISDREPSDPRAWTGIQPDGGALRTRPATEAGEWDAVPEFPAAISIGPSLDPRDVAQVSWQSPGGGWSPAAGWAAENSGFGDPLRPAIAPPPRHARVASLTPGPPGCRECQGSVAPGAVMPAGFGLSDPYRGCAPYDQDLGGPARLPAATRYRIRSGDVLQLTFQQTRESIPASYRLAAGDTLRINSDTHPELTTEQPVEIMPDGTVSIPGVQCARVAGMTLLEAKELLEERLVTEGKYNRPRITLLPVSVYQQLKDLLAAVDARFGTGGQGIQLTVVRDGTIALPSIGTICVVGLTKEELMYEINARYGQVVHGIQVTVNIVSTSPAFVYVLGQVGSPGRIEARLPITVLQAIAQAGGHLQGGKVSHVIVLRRTEDWRMVATRIDLAELNFAAPAGMNDMWLWDSDVVLVPKTRIQRLDELISLYLTNGVYAMLPSQLQFDQNSIF